MQVEREYKNQEITEITYFFEFSRKRAVIKSKNPALDLLLVRHVLIFFN